MFDEDSDLSNNENRRKKNEFEKELEKSMRDGNCLIF